MPHAVARLRTERLTRTFRPFLARGSATVRCPGCRLGFAYCLCALRPTVPTRAGVCLVMHDIEPLKPSNTGWLVADVVPDTEAFFWSRTAADPRLLAVLDDPKWQPYVVFPEDRAAPERVVREVAPADGRRPLFVVLDATWSTANKMFRRAPYLDRLPVLTLAPEHVSRYRLRCTGRDAQLCTAEVVSMCLDLAGDAPAARALDAWLDVFISHTIDSRAGRPPDLATEAHARLAALPRTV
jgi:DTW domain-containing protein YfiP